MSFNIEDQYQQFLYPDAMEHIKNERQGKISIYDDYVKPVQKKKPLPSNAIKVLIMNNPSKLNKRLIKFFTANLDYMNSKNIFFEWIVVYDDEMEHYEDQNITEFPMLILNNEKIAGAGAIINKLQFIINDTKRNIKKEQMGGDGELRNYFLKELDNKEDDDMDENDIFANTITQKIAAMNRKRQSAGQHTIKNSNPEVYERTARGASKKYNFNDSNHRQPAERDNNLEYKHPRDLSAGPPSASEIARVTNSGSIDDELMQKFWENMEETEL